MKEAAKLKFYLKRSKVERSEREIRGMPWDYPLFFMFTSEDMERIQRNYLDAQLHGFAPTVRKVCLTINCREGFTYRDLLEDMKKIPECSEEEFTWVVDIPHWNPIDKMDEGLQEYCNVIKMVKESNDGIVRDDPETKAILESFLIKADQASDLPDAPYERR